VPQLDKAFWVVEVLVNQWEIAMRLIAFTLVILAVSPSRLSADLTAITDHNDSYVVGYVSGGAGFSFIPSGNVFVTSLGYDASAIGAYGSSPVNVSLLNGSGDVLFSASITSNSVLRGDYYYEPITATPLGLGAKYYLRYGEANSKIWLGTPLSPEFGGAFTVTPELSYIGAAIGTNDFGIFPRVEYGPDILYIGGNFEFVIVPEPSFALLMILALIISPLKFCALNQQSGTLQKRRD
jgi:hypothetical protein